MKRIVILLVCIALLTSCAHRRHSYSEAWSNDDTSHWKACGEEGCGERVALAEHSFVSRGDSLQCSICQFIKSEDSSVESHVHTLTDGYTMSSAYHWRTCSECSARLDESAHSFGEGTVITPPTSDSSGIVERYCSVCGKGEYVTLDPLPEKMSEEEWRLAFTLDNVRIKERSKSGSVSSADTTYEVDGDLVASVESSGSSTVIIYQNREVLETIDLSDYYDSFSHHGDEIYKSEGFDLVTSSGKLKIKDAVIVFKNGELESLSYTISLVAFGAMSYAYTFYDRGEVLLDPTRLTEDVIRSMIDVESLSRDLILIYEKYEGSEKYTEYELTLTNEKYMLKSYQNGIYKGSSSGDSDAAANGLSSHLISIFNYISIDHFVYEEYYDGYTYLGDDVNVPQLGVITSFDISLSDGLIASLNIALSDGTIIYYEFQYP